ncbi:Arl8 [Symbiodinium microadriaticum]|nr:Arl8 [Symbiodinium microadriaticum]
MGNVFQRLLNMLFTKKLEVVLVGLENSGKTTLLQVLSDGSPTETAPTIGLNVKMVKRGGVQMKCWDLGGQSIYRAEWGRYTRGCNVIIFVVDAHAMDILPDVKIELHRLLEDRELSTTPLLVVANKIDLEPHATEPQLIKELNLDYIVDNPWIIIPCSALKNTNIDEVVQWLLRQADGTSRG